MNHIETTMQQAGEFCWLGFVKETMGFFLSFLLLLSLGACTQIQRSSEAHKPGSLGETFDEGADARQEEQLSQYPSVDRVAINTQDIPRVGLILGPGMGKTMAHAGVLAELDKKKIPVDAIVGLGWGAVVGALYAKEGKVHELAWKLYKFKSDQLPKSSLFSSRLEPEPIRSLDKFLSTSFKDQKLESLGVPFVCPTLMLGRSKVILAEKGMLKEGLKRCLATPPFYRPYAKTVTGSPGAVFQAVQYLKGKDIDVIVLVDVLSTDHLLSAETVGFESRLFWDTVRRQVKDSYSMVDEVILVHTKGRKMTDFTGRKSLVKSGEKAGRRAAERLAEKYGL